MTVFNGYLINIHLIEDVCKCAEHENPRFSPIFQGARQPENANMGLLGMMGENAHYVECVLRLDPEQCEMIAGKFIIFQFGNRYGFTRPQFPNRLRF